MAVRSPPKEHTPLTQRQRQQSCKKEPHEHKHKHTTFPLKMQLLISLLFLSLPYTILSLNQEGLYLQRVKRGLSDPAQSLSSWNERDDNPCNWYGITCDPNSRRVTSVDLSDSQVGGHFPTFLCRLPSLISINLSNGNINGSLTADDISACQSLEHLTLQANLLVGSLPEALARLPNLRELNLAENNFSGEIPPKFGEFPRLETLNIAGNLLSGNIPTQLANISTLKVLLIAYNPYTPGQIPSALANLTNLEFLWLADTKLVGHIPGTFLSRFTRLINLDLSKNKLTGSIPSELMELKNIEQIELYQNSLSGRLPAGWSNLTALRRLDLSTNHLSGMIPDELCELELESLNLMENKFEGTVPEGIAKSQNLYELKLFNNKLTGVLPSQLGLNSPLLSLDVSYNRFSGPIPENLCAKGALVDLILIYNSFSGEIPESLGKCHSLLRVRLRNNKLTGMVPQEFWGLPRVYLFELENNYFFGQVPNRIASAYNLSILRVSNNQFSGSIPVEIGFLGNLIEFSASRNKFTGQIPGSFVNLSMLSRLVLEDNELSGGLPAGIQNWKSLNELNLAKNKLSGIIPNEIGSLQVLNYLDLSENHFSGKIPSSLQNLKLNLLNLSNNMLSGELPPLYAKQMYKNSFVGNPGLCGDLEGLCPLTGDSRKQRYFWILISIFVIAGIVFVLGVVCFYFKYKTLRKAKKGIAVSKWMSFHRIDFSEFEIVDCLKEHNEIGSGASGKVYKVVLSNGETVAVKKLSEESKKDSSANSEKDKFEAEVETLGKIRHKNIVRLWCCYSAGDCKLLVYEYMPNGSLGDLLHSSKAGLLDWPTRWKIAIDAAEGLSYLHHDCVPPIVHRDVKSNNILLDAEFNARVADFGVAKVVRGVNKGTEAMSVIAGSCGYIAPEYAYTLRVNEKSDIYSFGVVLLELVTGKLPIDPEFGEKDLVKWVCTTLDQNGVDHLIDARLDSSYKEEICRVLDIGLCCTSSLPISRPSMRIVVKMLREAGAGSKPIASKKNKKLSLYDKEDIFDQNCVSLRVESSDSIRV